MTHDVASATNTKMGRPSGTVALLFSDLEGSTELLRSLGGDDYAHVMEEHRRVVRHARTAVAGRTVESHRDSFFAVFPRVRDATGAAADAQRTLTAGSLPADDPPAGLSLRELGEDELKDFEQLERLSSS